VAEQDQVLFVLSDELSDQWVISSLLNGTRSHPLPELYLRRPKGLPTLAYDHCGSLLLFVFCFCFTIHDLNPFELQPDFSHGIRILSRKGQTIRCDTPRGNLVRGGLNFIDALNGEA
jgi:hypothetical protein